MAATEGWSGVKADDVTARWPSSEAPPLDDGQIDTLIGDAEDLIERQFPDVPARVASGAIPRRRITRVIARMLIRLMRNPEGVRTVQQAGQSYSGSVTYGGDHPGELYLTDEDKRDLTGARTGGRAFAVRPALRRR